MKNKEYKHKKKFGQNFLQDRYILNKIEEVTNICEDDNVIEIGVGLGFLTEMLVEKAKEVIAFEIDDDLIPIINKKFSSKTNFKLHNIDFLKYDLSNLDKKYKVIANIPYYITTDIIEKLLSCENVEEIYIMVQKEVGLRLTSQKGSDVGLLTHNINFRADTEYLFTLDKEYFDPVPKVDSAFIRIVRKNKDYKDRVSEDKYFEFLKKAFSNKRKTLLNNLKMYDKSTLISVLQSIGKNENVRAEELSIDNFIDILNKLEEK